MGHLRACTVNAEPAPTFDQSKKNKIPSSPWGTRMEAFRRLRICHVGERCLTRGPAARVLRQCAGIGWGLPEPQRMAKKVAASMPRCFAAGPNNTVEDAKLHPGPPGREHEKWGKAYACPTCGEKFARWHKCLAHLKKKKVSDLVLNRAIFACEAWCSFDREL